MIRGFDASSVQGVVPFAAMASVAGMAFVLLKAWTGNDGPDPTFARNCAGALAAGIEPFGYAFAYPLRDAPGHPGRSPEEQARFFAKAIWSVLPGKPIFIDLEWPAPGDLAKWGIDWAFVSDWCRRLCLEVTRLCGGVKPRIYTYSDWWRHMAAATDVSWAADYALWMAWYVPHWPQPGDKPRIEKPWTDWEFWQWDGDKGERMTNGVDADFCVFNGEKADLVELVDVVAAATAPIVSMPHEPWPLVHPTVDLDPSDAPLSG